MTDSLYKKERKSIKERKEYVNLITKKKMKRKNIGSNDRNIQLHDHREKSNPPVLFSAHKTVKISISEG